MKVDAYFNGTKVKVVRTDTLVAYIKVHWRKELLKVKRHQLTFK